MTRPHKHVSQAILSSLNAKKQSVSSQITKQEAFGVDITRSRGLGWQAQDRHGEGGKEDEAVNKSFGGIFGLGP